MAVRAVQTSIGGRFMADGAMFGDGKAGRNHIHKGQGVGACRLYRTTIVAQTTKTRPKASFPEGVHGQPIRAFIISC
jgi:hypothetical protein